MKNELSDDELNALLREWKVSAEPHPRFAEDVWRRIARREAGAVAAVWPVRFQRWLSTLSRRTDFAWGTAAAVIVTVTAGWLGHWAAAPDVGAPGAGSYLASVDPYRMKP